jgi:cytosine/adenosine deaminase-related metal-dependent hydrolase
MIKLYKNGRILTPNFDFIDGQILISGEKIFSITPNDSSLEKVPETIIDLQGRLVFPGLINAHDHLYYTFWPKFETTPFQNWYEWEKAFKESTLFKRKQALSIADLYALGMYRNLFSGVCLIADHFPREVTMNFMGQPMITLLEYYALAHSVSSRSLGWGDGIKVEFKQTRGLFPFLLHCSEGSDREITEEVETLNRLGALAENTVLIGGIGFSDTDIELIAAKKASCIWCHVSSQQMFGKGPPIGKMLDAGIPLAIGTECSASGSMNFFDELRAIRAFSQAHLNDRLQPSDILRMATSVAAGVLRLQKTHGSIEPGKIANFLIFENSRNDPFESFMQLNPADISLMVHRGMMVYGDERFRSFCSADFSQFSEILVSGLPKLVLGKPLHLLERIEYKLGEPVKFPFMPIAEA